MKKKILGVALVIAGLTSVGMIHSASKRRDVKDQQDDRYGTYKQRLQRAKARGDKKMRSGGVIPLYAGVSFDQALNNYNTAAQSGQGPDVLRAEASKLWTMRSAWCT